jgi:hypothetical protein
MKRSVFETFISSLVILSSLLITLPAKTANFQLVDMGCRAITPPQSNSPPLRFRGQKIMIGTQEFNEVAIFDRGDYPSILSKKEPIFIVCPIASGNNSRFRTLRLQFGLNSRHDRIAPTTIVRLSLELNGQPYGFKDIRPGEDINWMVDITSKTNIGLTAECIQDDGRNAGVGCPPISFTDMTLSELTPSSLDNNGAKNTILLTEMKCTGGRYGSPYLRPVVASDFGMGSINPEQFFYINIGRRQVREVAFLSDDLLLSHNRQNNSFNKTIETSCTTPTYFKNLNITYGIDDQQKSRSSTIELSVYVNGQLIGTRSVSYGKEPETWNIPLSNPRSINLQAKCTSGFSCSRLSFTNLSLE